MDELAEVGEGILIRPSHVMALFVTETKDGKFRLNIETPHCSIKSTAGSREDILMAYDIAARAIGLTLAGNDEAPDADASETEEGGDQ